MPLRQCMEQTTFRDYKSWLRFLKHNWTQEKFEAYLARIALEIRGVLSTKSYRLEDFYINFISENPQLQELDLEEDEPQFDTDSDWDNDWYEEESEEFEKPSKPEPEWTMADAMKSVWATRLKTTVADMEGKNDAKSNGT